MSFHDHAEIELHSTSHACKCGNVSYDDINAPVHLMSVIIVRWRPFFAIADIQIQMVVASIICNVCSN